MKSFDINDTVLGKQTGTPSQYDASLLFRIPRSENRIKYDIQESQLPFTGYDVWNCYEFSFLTQNGLPVSRILKIIIPANSRYLVESKSLKLYLNSFNMERYEKTIQDSEGKIKNIILKDLNNLLECNVQISLLTPKSPETTPFQSYPVINDMIPNKVLESIPLTEYQESPLLLKGIKTEQLHEYIFKSDLLRSNCRVTNQPDWGDLFVRIQTPYEIDLCSVIAYIVSFRKENHFHEEVVEMIFKRLQEAFSPQKMMVTAMYTRRGGIDINPIRATHTDWLEPAFTETENRLAKTWRQ